MTCVPTAATVPTFGAEPRFAPNPIALRRPAALQPPFLLRHGEPRHGGRSASWWCWPCAPCQAVNKPPPSVPLERSRPKPRFDRPAARALSSALLTPLGGTRIFGSHMGYGLAMNGRLCASRCRLRLRRRRGPPWQARLAVRYLALLSFSFLAHDSRRASATRPASSTKHSPDAMIAHAQMRPRPADPAKGAGRRRSRGATEAQRPRQGHSSFDVLGR